MKKIITPTRSLKGQPKIPGDKSISHRSLIFGAIALGRTEVVDLLESGDVQSTMHCLRKLGIQISQEGDRTWIEGKGFNGWTSPTDILDCGNSGTTFRLLMGLIAGQEGLTATLSGDSSLVRRPMSRVAGPLRQMGAEILLNDQNYAPVTVQGRKLEGAAIDLKIASAQVKSAILLAGLTARGTTSLRGEIQSRDHTERMLKYFGVEVETTPNRISLKGGQSLRASKIRVPGDPSTAAFWIAAASLIEEADIVLENICLNPSRIGFIRVLQRMGASIEINLTSEHPEPVGTLRVRSSSLQGVEIAPHEIPSLIDELPLVALLATQAQGFTEVRGAEELRVKESDRLEAVAKGLRAMGAEIEVREDGFRIEGPQKLKGASIESFHDHRIAMTFSIAGLIAEGQTCVENADCVGISYPGFYEALEVLTQRGIR